MKEKTILSFIDLLKTIKEEGKTISSYCKEHNIKTSSIYNKMREFEKTTSKENGYYNEVVELYNSVLTKGDRKYNKVKDEKAVSIEKLESSNYTEINQERDEDGHIIYYSYKIYRKNKTPLIGKLNRDEMNIIYRLYSYYGSSVTQREVSRYFPELSLVDFKRILSAFNIYKASAPFAPHLLEEKTLEELREMQLREKENDFLRAIEEDRIRNNEKLLRKYANENADLKAKFISRESIMKSLLGEDYKAEPMPVITAAEKDSTLIVFLSDVHVGAYNETSGYIPVNDYDYQEITRRLIKVAEYVQTQKFSNLIVCNLGDSVDSYNKETTRGGHELPTLLSNKDQSKLFIKVMLEFFLTLKYIAKDATIMYYCVGESNHDGDWGWINNLLLAEKLNQQLEIKSYISSNPIDSFNVGNTSIIYLHGKDNKNQFKGFPLTLDNRTEDWFLHYFVDSKKDFKEKKCVVKGDLHQYAVTCSKSFDYVSAPSLYGSSNYIVANFGLTRWGCLVMEIDSNNNIKNTIVKD